MIPADQVALPDAPPPTDPAPADPPPADDGAGGAAARRLRSRLAAAHERLFVDAFRRVLRKELQAARRATQLAAQAHATAPLEAFRDAFYQDHGEFVARALTPATSATVDALAAMEAEWHGVDPDALTGLAALVEQRVRSAARHHVAQSRAALRRALEADEADRLRHLEAVLSTWEDQRAAIDAHVEVEHLTEAVRAAVHQVATRPAASAA
jgi:hypothetical protein